jgi:hypothetical protein
VVVARQLDAELRINPLRTPKELAAALGFVVSAQWVYRTLRRWCMTLKRAQYRNTHKYTGANLLGYCLWLRRIVALPWDQLKFADESHFSSRGMAFTRSVPLQLIASCRAQISVGLVGTRRRVSVWNSRPLHRRSHPTPSRYLPT